VATVVDVNVSLTPPIVRVVLTAVELEVEEVWRTVNVSPLDTVSGPEPHAPPFCWTWLEASPLIDAETVVLIPETVIVFEVSSVLSEALVTSVNEKASGVPSGVWLAVVVECGGRTTRKRWNALRPVWPITVISHLQKLTSGSDRGRCQPAGEEPARDVRPTVSRPTRRLRNSRTEEIPTTALTAAQDARSKVAVLLRQPVNAVNTRPEHCEGDDIHENVHVRASVACL
jgi:hypothetical protein